MIYVMIYLGFGLFLTALASIGIKANTRKILEAEIKQNPDAYGKFTIDQLIPVVIVVGLIMTVLFWPITMPYGVWRQHQK